MRESVKENTLHILERSNTKKNFYSLYGKKSKKGSKESKAEVKTESKESC